MLRLSPGAYEHGAERKEPGAREMEVSIVYESLFGNTRTVAEAIAAGIREADPAAQVTMVRTAGTGPGGAGPGSRPGRAELLIVGGPTHMLRMASPGSRAQGLQAAEKTARDNGGNGEPEPGADGPGVREWLDRAPLARPGSRAAAFDTRLPFPLAGGAARPIARQLRRHGYRLAAKPEGFIVSGSEGPMRDGELDRARAWGAALVTQATSAART